MRHFGPADEECPYCGEVFVKEAETPAQAEGVELEMEALKARAAAVEKAGKGTAGSDAPPAIESAK